MKKVLLSIALTGLFAFLGFNSQAQDIMNPTIGVKTTQNADTEEVEFPELPKFKSEAANKGMADLMELFKEYAPAIKQQDESKLMEFATKIQEQTAEMTNWAQELSADEQQEFQDYMMKVNELLAPEAD